MAGLDHLLPRAPGTIHVAVAEKFHGEVIPSERSVIPMAEVDDPLPRAVRASEITATAQDTAQSGQRQAEVVGMAVASRPPVRAPLRVDRRAAAAGYPTRRRQAARARCGRSCRGSFDARRPFSACIARSAILILFHQQERWSGGPAGGAVVTGPANAS
jgi:hypothetical protein